MSRREVAHPVHYGPAPTPIFVSPTEPKLLLDLGTPSMFPEHYGADFLKATCNGLAAIQRKEFPGDFLSSIRDGRMTDLLPKLSRATFPLLIIEGLPRWTSEGVLVGSRDGFTRAQFYGFMYSLQLRYGIPWIVTESTKATREAVINFFAWCAKDHAKPSSLDRRPGPGSGASDLQWGRHFLQGLPGVGSQLAIDLIDHFGSVRSVLSASREDLLTCRGLGKGRVDRILRVLGK